MKITKRFMDWYQGNNEDEKTPPKSGIRRVGYILWNYPGSLVLQNVLFLLCCIPVITIPAAIAAACRYIGKIWRIGYGFESSEFWNEFRAGWKKNLPIGLLVGVVGFYAYYLLSLANNFTGSGQRDIVTGIGTAVLIFAVLLGSYSLVMASMLDLPNKHLLKNALILMFVEWKTSILLTAETLLFWGCVLAFFPYSVVLMVFVGFSVQHLMICAMVIPVVQRRIVAPYEAQKELKSDL